MKLQPGHFYAARNGEIWCCYTTDRFTAKCVRVDGEEVDRFCVDGTHTFAARTLVAEVPAPEVA